MTLPRLKLRWQLLLSFLPVILTPVVILGLVVRSVTEQGLTVLVTREAEQQAVVLSPLYSQYYRIHGSWDGVDKIFEAFGPPDSLLPQLGNPQGGGGGAVPAGPMDNPGNGGVAALPPIMLGDTENGARAVVSVPPPGQVLIADNNGMVVAGDYPALTGQRLSPDVLAHGAPLISDGHRIGTLVVASALGVLDVEKKHLLDTLSTALLLTGLFTSVGSVGLALWLSGQLTAPVQELMAGVKQLASGHWANPLVIRSQNEFADLTDAFNAMAEQLTRQQQQQRQMIADIAHDLRTPLSVIGLEIAGIRAGLQSPEEATNSLQEEVDWLQHLIDDLHTLSLIDTGQFTLYPEDMSLTTYLSEIGNQWQGLAAKQNKTLACDIPTDLPVVQIDPFRMRQVLANVLNNALQHTPEGTRITLQASINADQVMIVVADNGPGIAAADLPHIFDRFYRADRARNRGRHGHGSGLGLSIAYQLVLMHHGTLAVESLAGAGTAFTIRLLQAGSQGASGTIPPRPTIPE